MNKIKYLYDEFLDLTGFSPSSCHVEKLLNSYGDLGDIGLLRKELRHEVLRRAIVHKLDLHKGQYKEIIDYCARKKVYFNYNEKVMLEDILLDGKEDKLKEYLFNANVSFSLNVNFLSCMGLQEAIKSLSSYEASKVEKVVDSSFSEFLFRSFPKESILKKISSECAVRYFGSYWEHLSYFYEKSLHRTSGGFFYSIPLSGLKGGVNANEYEDNLNKILFDLPYIYSDLANHCCLGVFISLPNKNSASIAWKLHSDIINYAERFREKEVLAGYFHPEKIKKITQDYYAVRYSNTLNKSEFETFSESFFYKDTYVYSDEKGRVSGMFIVLEKNDRDETAIPCPACRSLNVRGNSYPVIGVKSWECQNAICPERSASNRGKRYSLQSIVRQQAINDNKNLIPKAFLKKHRLDLVKSEKPEEDAFSLFWRCYSLSDDIILTNSCQIEKKVSENRKIKKWDSSYNEFSQPLPRLDSLEFWKRIYYCKDFHNSYCEVNKAIVEKQMVIQGDSMLSLARFPDCYFDGGVTSPPYYNAREYSQWPNIYCYLSDMRNIMAEVFRVLKPGAPFLFNVFDYFDNENNLVFSAMGKRRLALGPLLIFLFKDIGFNLAGNLIWFKGEIEGSRNFNQGNLSPYYQAPHNAWEHVYVLSKGEPDFDTNIGVEILSVKPVRKMVGGVNTYGHSAPFPPEIPRALFGLLKKGDKVLDPFAGSMTTLIEAKAYGMEGVGIEMDKTYWEKGKYRLEAASNIKQLSIF